MKKQKIMLIPLFIYVIFLCAVSVSLAWFGAHKTIDPNLSFSAGSPEEYKIYKITCENDSTSHVTTEVSTVGTDGFSIDDLQLGKITNLAVLENSNYIYYAIRIPKTDLGTVSLGICYSDADSDGAHFKIYVPSKNSDGDIEYENGEIKTLLFEDEETLEAIKAIETDNTETFITYSALLTPTAPDSYASIDEIEALFADSEVKSMNASGQNGYPVPSEYNIDPSLVSGDYYYAYVRLVPNVSLYKHFIDYLWDNMPFFLAYEIRVTLEVLPQAAE